MGELAVYGATPRDGRYREDLTRSIVEYPERVDAALAITLGDKGRLRQCLVDDPALLEQVHQCGPGLLHLAAEQGKLDRVAVLLEAGVDPQATDQRGERPIDLASHAGPWKLAPADDVVQYLREFGGPMSLIQPVLATWPAVEACLLAKDHVDQQDVGGRTSLFWASRNNHSAVVERLLDAKANPNIPTSDGQTALSSAALHCLSQECDPIILVALIDHGAECGLLEAVAADDYALCCRLLDEQPQALLAHGEDSPLYYAIHCWRPRILEELLRRGARECRGLAAYRAYCRAG